MSLSRPCAAAVLVVALGLCSWAVPAARQVTEHGVKAAFLFNFTKFIDWPDAAFAGTTAPFEICVMADPSIERELRALLHGEKVRGRRISITAPAALDDLRTCHLVYFGAQQRERSTKLLEALRQYPVLTVGEGRKFVDQGGMIGFLIENNRVRFDISKRGADAAGLNVSSKLLRVAREVVAP